MVRAVARADVRAEHVRPGPDGTRFSMVMPHGRVELFLRLVGLHNVHNALAAAAAALSLGASELTVASRAGGRAFGAGAPRAASKRRSATGGRARRFVDYAHTPDALDKVCGTLRRTAARAACTSCSAAAAIATAASARRWPRAVARHAHVAYLTSDNPRSEDPETILDDMEAGLQGGKSELPCASSIAPRPSARRSPQAEPGDTVLIAGKGHETYQMFKDSVVPFDDRLEAARALAAKEAGWLHR